MQVCRSKENKKRIKAGNLVLDYKNIYGESLITSEDIELLRSQWEQAIRAAKKMVKDGTVEGHVSKNGTYEPVLFSRLPYIAEGNSNSPAVIEQLEELKKYSQEHIDMVVSFGIGGSYLGNKIIFDLQCGEFWNAKSEEARHHFPKVIFAGMNADSRYIGQLIDFIQDDSQHKESYHVALLVISKSGTTIEPLSNFMIVKERLEEAGISVEVIAVTGQEEGEKETVLHKIATKEQWRQFAVPEGVGGRFSVFSEVGLVFGAMVGFDFRAFLDGARSIAESAIEENPYENPALLSALFRYIGAVKYGKIIEVMMPYAGCLKSASEWYVQLLAESIGKGERRDGRKDPYSRTPVSAVGSMDMHAQTQEHQEGLDNKIVTFLHVEEWDYNVVVPHMYSEYEKIEAFSGVGLDDILDAARESNEEALSSANRFNMTYSIPKLNAFYLGAFLFLQCWAIFYEGELANVDAFNQPGVEVYKRLLGPKIRKLKERKDGRS